MSRPIFATKAVLFDWDGTLLNSFRADERAYRAMFQALGIDFTTEDLARHYHPDWYHVYRAARLDRSRWGEADRIWRLAYARENPKLLPGARATLRRLAKRFILGIVTSGSRDRVCIQLKDLALRSHFAVCVCAEDARSRKPHPAPLRRALALADLKPDDCVYVGDSPQDIEMARRAGVRAIGILGPFPTARRLRAAQPALLLASLEELPKYLARVPQISQQKEVTGSPALSSKRARTKRARTKRVRTKRPRVPRRRSGA